MSERNPNRELNWQRKLKSFDVYRGKEHFKNIESISRSNTVLHVSPKSQNPHDVERTLLFGGSMSVLFEDRVSHDPTGLFSNTNPNSPFSHNLYQMYGTPGKLLQFTKGNIIKNGKYSGIEHIQVIMQILRFLNLPYFGAIGIPNNVISAYLKRHISQKIKNDPRCVWSSKYPGISYISSRKRIGKSNCTPTLYTGYNKKNKVQNQSTVNFAGVKTAEDLYYHLCEIDELTMKYSNPDSEKET